MEDDSSFRLSRLLNKNRNGQLDATEVAELDLYEQLDQMMRMLKLQAFSMLKDDAQTSVAPSD